MRHIAIVSKPNKPELSGILEELIPWLRAHQFEPLLDHTSGTYSQGAAVLAPAELQEKQPELVVVLGGDGTLLGASRIFARLGTPILSVNLGSLGFLTEVRLSELYATLADWCTDCGSLDVRSMLHAELWRNGAKVCDIEALNDIVIAKGTIARMGHFNVIIDGHPAAEYKADGIIVATPTGSTAYSLSAGGPILEPSVDANVVTPVCPHTLTMRPLVVGGSALIQIRVIEGAEPVYLTVDGQESQPLVEGDELRCRRSDYRVKLLRVGTGSFYDVLRTKLKWGAR